MRVRRSIIWGKSLDPDETQRLCEGAGDAICLDLEDGVPGPRKEEARKKAVDILHHCHFHGKERIVRVNDYHSEDFKRDMETVVSNGLPDAIRVPKCEKVEDMLDIDRQLREIEAKAGLTENQIEIIAMIESPMGIRLVYEIASCSKRITAVNLGMEDLTRELGVLRRYENNELDLLYARQKFVLDAKAAHVQALDSVLLKADDTELTRVDSMRSKQDGFTGRSCHGNIQAEYANKIYAPDPEYLAWSVRAKKAYEDSIETGEMPSVDGKLICYAAYEKACDVIGYAEEIKELESRQR